MLKKKSNKLIAILLSVLMSGLIPAVVALADNIVIDGDSLVPITDHTLNFGEVEQGSVTTRSVLLAIKRSGNTQNVFKASSPITLTHSTPTDNYLSALMTDSSITTIAGWASVDNNDLTEDTATSEVTLAIPLDAIPGTQQTATIIFSATGTEATGNALTRTGTLTITYTVITSATPIDSTNPTATHTLSPEDWTNGNVEINVTAHDSGSGLKSISGPLGTIVNGETASLLATANGSFTFTLEDNAGNIFDYVVEVDNIDSTAPSATHFLTPSTWTNGNVVITVNAEDLGSGLKSITGPEGTVVDNGTATYTATTNGSIIFTLEDNVGNAFDYVVEVDTIDTTAPTAGHTLTPSSWTNGDVVITVNAQDLGSGLKSITGPTGTVVDNGTATYTATVNSSFTFIMEDNAGNSADYIVHVDKIDRIAPTASHSLTPSTWTNGNVEIIITGDDDASGLKSITGPLGTVVIEGTATFTATTNGSFTFTLEDNAGNTFDSVVTVENIDRINPTATNTLDPESWTSGDVKIVVIGDDEASGVESINLLGVENVETPLTLLDGESDKSKKAEHTVSENGTYVFLVKDQAGNSFEHTVVVSNIDKTKPQITITTPAEGTSYKLYEVVLADWSATDALSGLSSSSGTVASGLTLDTSSIGSKTFTVTATDFAGNTETKTVNYSVIYDFKGFFQPVDMNGVLNVVKAGSSIPIKFSLSGDMGLDIFNGLPAVRNYIATTNTPLDSIETVVAVTAGNSSLSFDPVTNQYTYVWKTDKLWAGKDKQLVVRFNDGTEYTANFRFK